MSFKEKSAKELAKMSKEEETLYWEDFKKYYSEIKKETLKLKREYQTEQNKKNKKAIDHATFLLFGELIKSATVQNEIKTLSQSKVFTEEQKQKINLLLTSRKIDIKF